MGANGDRVRVVSPTEERNPRTFEIDTVPVLALLELINDEDASVATAVRTVLPTLAGLVELAADRLGEGGRVHYFGAGSSGRLGLLDAAEIPPTYGLDHGVVVAHMAGGNTAMQTAHEGSEDDDPQGEAEALAVVAAADVVIGLTASGYTPYVGGALRASRAQGAHTALITSNPGAPLNSLADTVICVETGAEVITGSTRMKSATAQKLVLNAFSTAVMVLTGRTWSNLMVDMVPSNNKLRGRLILMLSQATGQDEPSCEAALVASRGEAKTALVTMLAGVDPATARVTLAEAGGLVAGALDRLADRPTSSR